MKKYFAVLLLAVGLCGCAGLRFGPYTSPAIAGRVLAADTRQPLPSVEVRRGGAKRIASAQPKGAELLMEKGATRTARDGSFALGSERALTLFRPAGWDHVKLTFQKPGYERFQTNYSILTPGTNTPTGAPLIQAGDILLQPLRK